MNESINNLRLSNDDFKIDYYNSRLSLNESNINRVNINLYIIIYKLVYFIIF